MGSVIEMRPNKTLIQKCLFKDCDGKYWAKGFCNKHYKRVRKQLMLNVKFESGQIAYREKVRKAKNELRTI